jgi:multiple sugar transport system permease protein
MTLARASRLLLAIVSLAIVMWAFFDVGRRACARWQLDRQRPITLTLLHWGGKDEADIVQRLADEYMRKNPRVRIVRIGTPGSGEMNAKLKTLISAGTPPDLFYLAPDMLAEMAELKLVRPVDDLVEREIAQPGGQVWFDDYYPLLIKAFRYDATKQTRGEGPLFGLPKDFTTALFYINIDLFEHAGVDWRRIQSEGWTWDEFEAVMRRISSLSGTRGFEGRQIYGGTFEIWADTIRNIVWTFGGDFFGTKPDGTPDFRNVTLDDPTAQEALEFLHRVCRVDQTVYYPSSKVAREGGQEFFNGNIGCVGPVGRWKVPRFKDISAFNWDVVPVPFKSKQHQASQIYYTAWAMSKDTDDPDEAFKLMKFLCGGEGAILQSRQGLAIPPLQSIANSPDFLAPQGIPRHNAQVFLDATAYMRLQQIPREPEWNRLLPDQVNRCIQLGELTPLQAATEAERLWLQELNSPLRRREWQPMRWNIVLAAGLALCATLTGVLWWRAHRERMGPLDRAQERAGFAFILPWVIGFLLLTLGPMLVSLLLSFTKWGAMTPISEARAVGTANYAHLFAADPKFIKSLRVTLLFVAMVVPLSQVAALGVAVLMNVRVRGIATYRTIFFVPSLIVVSVVGAVLWMQMYNNQYGIVNEILRPILRPIGLAPPDWFGTDARRWAIPAFVLMSLWGVGGAMILYLAGLKGIPTSLYEAATIDGAGRAGQFWHVTLPMLSPLIFYNVVMGLIGSFQFFIAPMVMTEGGPNDLTLFYVLNLYRQAFEFHNMGYASAMAWVLFLILLGLTIVIFRGSKNLVYYEGLKT